MIFSDLLELLNKLSLPEDQFVIVGSGPLGVRNIRECRDLDVLVTDKLWIELAKKYPVKKEHGIDKIEVAEGIEMLSKGSAFRDPSIASIDEIIRTADLIEGIRYINLELLKKFKQKMAREKDLKDIELIKDYLSTHQS